MASSDVFICITVKIFMTLENSKDETEPRKTPSEKHFHNSNLMHFSEHW